jgi:hypothetical protein
MTIVIFEKKVLQPKRLTQALKGDVTAIRKLDKLDAEIISPT